MKNGEILEKLDLIDKYIAENIGWNGKIENSENIFARMNIGIVQQIKKELDEKNIGGFIRNRVKQTENALMYVTNRADLSPDNKYFDWLNATMQDTYYSKPDYMQLYYDICTGHQPCVYAKYAREYLPMDVPGREELLYNFEVLEKEYSEFREKDKDEHEKKQETALVVKKRNPIQRFFDKIFNRGKQKEDKNASNIVSNKPKPAEPQTTTDDRHTSYRETLAPKNYSQEPLPQRKEEQKLEQIVVISDLHGDPIKWEWIKQEMIVNPNMKILILGDALDRGDYGTEILLQIKELCDQGRAQYLPGNHDTFAYNYVRTNEILKDLSDSQKRQNPQLISIAGRELAQLTRNGGETTIEQLENFDKVVQQEIRNGNIKHNISKKELIDWLGKQPIQKKINVNGITYALSHAYFDDDLYNYDNQFNMEKALQIEMSRTNEFILNKFRTAMWYREGDTNTQYAPVTYPKDCVMVVGHTPQAEVNISNLQNDPNKPVIYVDIGKNRVSGFDLSNRTTMEFEPKTQYDGAR